MADALAAYITPKLIDAEVYGYCSFGGYLFDLRKMEPHTPFPEGMMYWLAPRQLIRHVLGETTGAEFVLDMGSPQDVFQVAFAASLAICAGATVFLGVGAVKTGSAGDCGFDPITAVIQADIIRHCARLARGLPYREEESLALQTIREAVFESATHSFLDHPTTLDYRELYLEPALFFRYSGEQLREEARRIVKSRLAEHCFTLPDDRTAEMAEIYSEAEEVLARVH
jgi:trimethylamine:corrinoid methyltransferase-like protein